MKWTNELNLPTEINWNLVHRYNFSMSSDTKLRWFQFRLVHRILATNKFLHKIGIKNNPMCSFCKIEEETIVHLFYECDIVHDFLLSFERWIYNETSIFLNFTKTDCLFGKMNNKARVENLLLLIFKFYVYKQRCREEELFLPTHKAEILYYYKQARYSSVVNSNTTLFDCKWQKYVSMFNGMEN